MRWPPTAEAWSADPQPSQRGRGEGLFVLKMAQNGTHGTGYGTIWRPSLSRPESSIVTASFPSRAAPIEFCRPTPANSGG